MRRCFGYCFTVSSQRIDIFTLTFELRFLLYKIHSDASWLKSCFYHLTGVTGVLLVMVATVMYTFATPYARRRVFRFFWTAHQLYIVLYVLCIIHGSARLVQSPDFFKFFLFPAIVFTIDKLISVSRRKVEIPVLQAELLPSGNDRNNSKLEGLVYMDQGD